MNPQTLLRLCSFTYFDLPELYIRRLARGETVPLSEAARALLAACKDRGYHTAIETCGYTKTETILDIARYVDLFLFDIKQMDPVKHKQWTGVNNEQILANIRALLEKLEGEV